MELNIFFILEKILRIKSRRRSYTPHDCKSMDCM